MEQRFYHGNIDPNGLADYLVNNFGSGYYRRTMAQKVGQGDHLLVQIATVRSSGRIRNSLGVSIGRTADGITVSTGQSNWIDESVIGTSIIGALFWPPLLLFPLARGIRSYTMYQDIWNAIDTYCAQVGATQGNVTDAHAVYCRNCGSMNEENATECAVCGAPLHAGAGQPQQQAPQYRPPTPQYQPPMPNATTNATASTVVCPSCGHTVAAANFCSNCAAPLPTQG